MAQCLIRWTSPTHIFIFSKIGQEQRFLLVPHMQGSGLWEWMRKFITEGVVNHSNLDINFVLSA